jgi:hypothetical protein
MPDIFTDSAFNQDLTPWVNKLAHQHKIEIKKYVKT